MYGPRGRIILRALVFSLLFALLPEAELRGQEGRILFNTSGAIDWTREEINVEAGFSLAQAGIKLPAGRFMGEETLNEAYPRLLRNYLLTVRLDSNSTIETLIESGALSLGDLDRLSLEADKVPPSLSPDLSRMNAKYTVSLGKISDYLSRQRQTMEAPKPLIPVQAASYTGIIIVAPEELPVRGRRSLALMEPCIFPKIWDTNMNLVYEHSMLESGRGLMVRYTTPENIFKPVPSGLDGELAALAGANPLRILAREVFGIFPTDPVIDRDDALKILSNENNRRLLREGRVIFVLNSANLKKNITVN